MAYDKETDVLEHSMAYVSIRQEQFSGRDHISVVIRGKKLRQDLKNGPRGEAEDRRAQLLRVMKSVEEKLGDDWEESAGWMMCKRTNLICVVPTSLKGSKKATKDASKALPCARWMSKDMGRWTSFWYCDRPSNPENPGGICNVCNGARKRVETKENAERERRERINDEQARLQKLADDLDELYQLACDKVGIDEERRGKVRITKGYKSSQAYVDDEALFAILRTFVESEWV